MWRRLSKTHYCVCIALLMTHTDCCTLLWADTTNVYPIHTHTKIKASTVHFWSWTVSIGFSIYLIFVYLHLLCLYSCYFLNIFGVVWAVCPNIYNSNWLCIVVCCSQAQVPTSSSTFIHIKIVWVCMGRSMRACVYWCALAQCTAPFYVAVYTLKVLSVHFFCLLAFCCIEVWDLRLCLALCSTFSTSTVCDVTCPIYNHFSSVR